MEEDSEQPLRPLVSVVISPNEAQSIDLALSCSGTGGPSLIPHPYRRLMRLWKNLRDGELERLTPCPGMEITQRSVTQEGVSAAVMQMSIRHDSDTPTWIGGSLWRNTISYATCANAFNKTLQSDGVTISFRTHIGLDRFASFTNIFAIEREIEVCSQERQRVYGVPCCTSCYGPPIIVEEGPDTPAVLEHGGALLPHQAHDVEHVLKCASRKGPVEPGVCTMTGCWSGIHALPLMSGILLETLETRQFNWSVISDTMGLGKTRTAWAAVANLLGQGDGKALILCNPILTSHWIEEGKRLTAALAESGNGLWDHGKVMSNTCVVSKNTFIARVRRQEQNAVVRQSPRRRNAVTSPLNIQGGYSVIVMDEAHQVCRRDGSKHFANSFREWLAKYCPSAHVILVSGTLDSEATCLFKEGGWRTVNRHHEFAKRAVYHDRPTGGMLMPVLHENKVEFDTPPEVARLLNLSDIKAKERHMQVSHHSFRVSLLSGLPSVRWWENERGSITTTTGFAYDDPCAICLDTKIDPVLLPCQHTFCEECALHWLHSRSHSCPTCRQRASPNQLKRVVGEDYESMESDAVTEPAYDLGKMEWLLQLIGQSGDEKVFVFAERLAVCEDIAGKVEEMGIPCHCLNSVSNQGKTLQDFIQGTTKVLISTPRLCSVGLDMKTARHVVFWTRECSQRTVDQCMTRLRRMGGMHPVVTAHFLDMK